MRLGVLAETHKAELRVAATPETVKRFRTLGLSVVVESKAGVAAGYPDAAYEQAGAFVTPHATEVAAEADILLKVRRLLLPGEMRNELGMLKSGCIVIGLLAPYQDYYAIDAYARAGITAMAMELIPHISRAQTMDVLSSQAHLAGYKAVLEGLNEFGRVVPMMSTAAGTLAPAKVLVIGTRVAGLQAIATAVGLGGVVSATDMNPGAKEQVESLGASFVDIDNGERRAQNPAPTSRPMSDTLARLYQARIRETIVHQDIVITTTSIPGKSAPRLITAKMVRSMKPGSVIVDLAVEQGGNCQGSLAGQVVDMGGVRIVGHRNMAGRLPTDASALYARNLSAFVALLVDCKANRINPDYSDEIISAVTLTRQGSLVHPLCESRVHA